MTKQTRNGPVLKYQKKTGNLVSQTPTPLFVRYNQTPQAEPDRNYEPDIFDRFLHLPISKTMTK